MGNSSSQAAQSQAATQDVPVTSQPATQLAAPDGTHEEQPQPQPLKSVAPRMDATVEDTIRKAKKARMKALPRAQRKSAPQHTRGFAIQPSQEIPDTQKEAPAGAGAEDDDVDMNAEEEHAVEGIAISQPTGRATHAAEKAKMPQGKKKRLRWHEDDGEPTIDGADAEQGALEDIDVNTLNDKSPPTKQKKRKRSNIELERVQKDVQDFAPEFESTPKPKPTTKRQKRAKDVEKHDVTAGQDEVNDAAAHVKPQKRSKTTKVQAEKTAGNHDSELNTLEPTSKRVRPVKVEIRSGNVDLARTTTSNTRSQPKQKSTPIEDAPDELPGVHEEQAVPEAEGAPSEDGNGDGQPVDSIPTPPESPDDPAPPRDGEDEVAQSNSDDGGNDNAQDVAATGRARTSQEVSAPVGKISKSKKSRKREQAAEDAEDAQADGDNEQRKVGNPKGNEDAGNNSLSKSKKRRPAPAASENDDNEDDGDKEFDNKGGVDDEVSDDSGKLQAGKAVRKSKNSRKQKKASSDDDDPSRSQRGQIQGMWSKEERARADEIFHDIVRVTAIPSYELKANIIDWKNPTPALSQLKEELYESFPERSFKSIARFCQRRYNAFERGKWTAEQDQLLRAAFELWPDQWTVIGDHVSRYWEDCRTRWRDVLSRPETKSELGPWSREEELRLAKAVQECREIVLKETKDEEVREDTRKADALISWKVVAQKMDNTRVAKRCREKWKRIKHLDLSADVAPTDPQSTKGGKTSSRMRNIEEHYQECEPGDIFDILTEICNAVPDVTKTFDHETTFWSVVAIKNPNSRFSSSLRRRALKAAVDQYPCKAVWEAETLAAKANGVKDRMQVLEREDQIELSRAFVGRPKEKPVKKATKARTKDAAAGEENREPAKKKATKSKKPLKDPDDASGDESGQKIAKKARQPSEKTKKEYVKKYKSAHLIVNSDDDDQETAAGGNDVQVAQTQDEKPAASEGEEEEEEEEEGDGGADEGRARQQTDELSLDFRSPDLSPSTFIERCKGGKKGRVDKGQKEGKGGKKRREGVKG